MVPMNFRELSIDDDERKCWLSTKFQFLNYLTSSVLSHANRQILILVHLERWELRLQRREDLFLESIMEQSLLIQSCSRPPLSVCFFLLPMCHMTLFVVQACQGSGPSPHCSIFLSLSPPFLSPPAKRAGIWDEKLSCTPAMHPLSPLRRGKWIKHGKYEEKSRVCSHRSSIRSR